MTRPAVEILHLRQRLAQGRFRQIAPGEVSVKLVLPDGTTYARDGRLAFQEISVDPGTGSVTLRAIFPNPEGELLPGLYVRAVLQDAVDEAAILVPQQAVERDPRGLASVLVVNARGLVEARSIEVGRTVGERWLVESGLAAGDRVIVEGTQKARPGRAVRAVPASGGGA